jgi:hypothetical protein
VGSATTLAADEASDDDAPAALLDGNAYTGDKKHYLAGFADDTRYRESGEAAYIDWVSVSNTTTVRKAETARLLTKGGWWDHADGNRVSTTCGDKIEVIQGNYKLVVLGRQNPSPMDGSAAIADLSGGHEVNQDAAPNANVMCVEYVQEDGIWTVFEDNGTGNLTSRFHGERKEMFTGKRKESTVGSSPGSYDGSLTHLPDDSQDPVIVDKTWAQRIETYIGSDGKPVPSIYTLVNAEAINEVRAATEITSTTTAAVVLETVIGTKTDIVVGAATDIVVGAKIEFHVGPRFHYHNLRNEIAVEKSEAALLKTELHDIWTHIGNSETRLAVQSTRLLNSSVELKASIAAVSGSVTKVEESVTTLREAENKLAGEFTLFTLWGAYIG